jgi:hypothetical protein
MTTKPGPRAAQGSLACRSPQARNAAHACAPPRSLPPHPATPIPAVAAGRAAQASMTWLCLLREEAGSRAALSSSRLTCGSWAGSSKPALAAGALSARPLGRFWEGRVPEPQSHHPPLSCLIRPRRRGPQACNGRRWSEAPARWRPRLWSRCAWRPPRTRRPDAVAVARCPARPTRPHRSRCRDRRRTCRVQRGGVQAQADSDRPSAPYTMSSSRVRRSRSTAPRSRTTRATVIAYPFDFASAVIADCLLPTAT